MTSQPSPNPKSRKAMSIVFGLLIASASAWGVQSANGTPSDPTKMTVRYGLTGAGVAGYVTYQSLNGQQHATNVALPWSMQFTDWATSQTTSAAHVVSAQGTGPGSLTCTIEVDGKVVSRNTAAGDPPRVVCENHDSPTPESGAAG
ncbi:MAG TPA: MmpS family transport accessory protein [Mycobacterium sp.]|nr:MmpS family transport accessory protein [Mycobacterium sp.]